jgi:hypothetical protein
VPEPTFDELIEAMKVAAGILQQEEIAFVIGGGLAAWARGGPRTEHDVDILLKRDDAERAVEAFERAGLRIERPPEGWLYKAWTESGIMIDLIFSPAGGPVTEARLEEAPMLEVAALRVRVQPLEDLMSTKLLALTEQEPNFEGLLELARALREQIDWDTVRARTESSPFAKAFFTLVESLGIVEPAQVETSPQ